MEYLGYTKRKLTLKYNLENKINSIISEYIEKDVFVAYLLEKFWKEMKKKTDNIVFDFSEIDSVVNRQLILKCRNSVIKNEIFLEKTEIIGLINLYLENKLGEKYIRKLVLK